MEIVKNGGALQRLVANKYIGEKKKGLYEGWILSDLKC